MVSGWELVTRKTKHMIRGLELWASLTPSEGRGLEIELNHRTIDLLNPIYIIKLH